MGRGPDADLTSKLRGGTRVPGFLPQHNLGRQGAPGRNLVRGSPRELGPTRTPAAEKIITVSRDVSEFQEGESHSPCRWQAKALRIRKKLQVPSEQIHLS